MMKQASVTRRMTKPGCDEKSVGADGGVLFKLVGYTIIMQCVCIETLMLTDGECLWWIPWMMNLLSDSIRQRTSRNHRFDT